MIKLNTFAAACFDQNSIADLEEALKGKADRTDMKTWKLSARRTRVPGARTRSNRRPN